MTNQEKLKAILDGYVKSYLHSLFLFSAIAIVSFTYNYLEGGSPLTISVFLCFSVLALMSWLTWRDKRRNIAQWKKNIPSP